MRNLFLSLIFILSLTSCSSSTAPKKSESSSKPTTVTILSRNLELARPTSEAQKTAIKTQCGEQIKAANGGITNQQTISSGQIIYQKELLVQREAAIEKVVVLITYIGLTNNNIQIKYVTGATFGNNYSENESGEVLLPLDANKQAILKIAGIGYGHWGTGEDGPNGVYFLSDGICVTDSEEIILKVIDGKDRISATLK